MTDIKTKPDPYDDWYVVERDACVFVGKRAATLMLGTKEHGPGSLSPYYKQCSFMVATPQGIAAMDAFKPGRCRSLRLTPYDDALPLLEDENARAIIAQIEQAETQKRAASSGIALVGAGAKVR